MVDLRICPLPFKNTKILHCCILGALHVKFHGKILNKFQDLNHFTCVLYTQFSNNNSLCSMNFLPQVH